MSKPDAAAKSKAAIWTAIAFGSVPILGLLISLLLNWCNYGNPFISHEFDFLPLIFTTFPCLGISNCLDSVYWFCRHPMAMLFLYTFICAGVYAMIGYWIALTLQMLNHWLSCNPKSK